MSVCTDGARMYVLWPSGEASPTHLALDGEGKKVWGANGNHSLGNGLSWCVRDGWLYQLGVRGVLKMQARDGLHVAFATGNSTVPLARDRL